MLGEVLFRCLGSFFHENFKYKFLTPVWNRKIFKKLTICLTEKKILPLILHCEEFYLCLTDLSFIRKTRWVSSDLVQTSLGRCLQYVLVWNPVSLASPGKQGGNSPSAPCCDKGASVLAYPFLELLHSCCCEDGEMWEHDVSSSLQSLHWWGVEVAVWRMVLMPSGGQGYRFFLAIVEREGKALWTSAGLLLPSVRDRRKPLFSPAPSFSPPPT